jgi:hypothetical protein
MSVYERHSAVVCFEIVFLKVGVKWTWRWTNQRKKKSTNLTTTTTLVITWCIRIFLISDLHEHLMRCDWYAQKNWTIQAHWSRIACNPQTIHYSSVIIQYSHLTYFTNTAGICICLKYFVATANGISALQGTQPSLDRTDACTIRASEPTSAHLLQLETMPLK